MSNDEWRDYVPPTDRGAGEAALPKGVARKAQGGAPVGSPAGAARGQLAGGMGRIKGTRACYVDAGATCVVTAEEAKRHGFDKRKGEWIRFHSTREAKRWIYLRGQERAGLVRELRRQVKFPLLVQRPDKLLEQIATWTCDFDYAKWVGEGDPRPPAPIDGTPGSTITFENNWQRVVEDSKGWKTEIYIRSQKHFEAQYGIRITET